MNENLATLADIELPAPPDWRPWIVLAAVAVLIVIGIMVVYIRGRRPSPSSPVPAHREKTGARAALPRLERLQREWAAGAIDPRTAAYRLVTLLRLGLRLPQLHPAGPPAGLDESEWRKTLCLLQDLRYRPAPDQVLTADVFARAQSWLRQHESASEPRRV